MALPSWSAAGRFLTSEIEKNWVGEDLDNPYTSFIDRKRLKAIWEKQIPDFANHTPFSTFRRCVLRGITLDDFCENLLRLVSALTFVGWDRISGDGAGCYVQWYHQDGLSKCWISIPRDQHGDRRCLNDSNLPLDGHDIDLLFSDQREKRVAFRDNQFAFCPLVIQAGTPKPQEFSAGMRLPFESEEMPDQTRGWYGQVTRVTFVEGYIRQPESAEGSDSIPPLPRNRVLACKTFRLRENFSREHNILTTLGRNARHHSHIMMHVAAFIVGHQFKILFPCAWGNLNSFLNLRPEDYPGWLQPNELSPFNLLREGSFIGDALAFLHEGLNLFHFGTRKLFHMDLKPDNILVLGPIAGSNDHPLGVWKITDFGLSDFGTSGRAGLKSMGDFVISLSGSETVREAGPFQAPEAEKFPRPEMDQVKADVWSFGCVLAHLLAFSAHGPRGIEQLQVCLSRTAKDADGKHRNGYFYSCSKEGAPALVSALNRFLCQPFRKETTANIWFSKAWNFVRQHCLSVEPGDRLDARAFCEDLQSLVVGSNTPATCLFAERRSPFNTAPPSLSPALGAMRYAAVDDSTVTGPSQHLDQVNSFPESPSRAIPRKPLGPSRTEPPGKRKNSITNIRGHRSRISQSELSEPSSEMYTPSSPAASEMSSRVHGSTRTQNSTQPPSIASEDIKPVASRQSGSFTAATSLPLQQQPSLSPYSSASPRSSIQIQDQFKRIQLKPEVVALSPDGKSLLLSDNRKVAWSRLPPMFTPSLEILPNQRALRSDLVHLTESSVLIQQDNKHLVLYARDPHISAMTSSPANTALDRMMGGREIWKLRRSATGSLAIEFLLTIEVFGPDFQTLIVHEKEQQDQIKDLAFDASGCYLTVLSQARFWTWSLGESSERCHSVEKAVTFSKDWLSGFLKPRILPLKGIPHFLVQDLDHREREFNIATAQGSVKGRQKLEITEGILLGPVLMTLDGRELFGLVWKKRTTSNSTCMLQRWKISVESAITIQLLPQAVPLPELSLSKHGLAQPGLAMMPFHRDGQNLAVIAHHGGQILWAPLDRQPG